MLGSRRPAALRIDASLTKFQCIPPTVPAHHASSLLVPGCHSLSIQEPAPSLLESVSSAVLIFLLVSAWTPLALTPVMKDVLDGCAALVLENPLEKPRTTMGT